MKFNPQLKNELIRYEKKLYTESLPKTDPVFPENQKQTPFQVRDRPVEKVVGGEILWKPIDRSAAMLLAKAPWWAQPVHVSAPIQKPEQKPTKPKRKKKPMKGAVIDSGHPIPQKHGVAGDYISNSGLHIKMVGGEPMINISEAQDLICREVNDRLEKMVNPQIKAAQDARKIIDELLHGIGGDMEKFRANTKIYLEEIRQTRFSMVTETAQITKSLGEVRQFFLGSDFKDERQRMMEFVDLCERLYKLKQTGFLDSVADTMLRLADKAFP